VRWLIRPKLAWALPSLDATAENAPTGNEGSRTWLGEDLLPRLVASEPVINFRARLVRRDGSLQPVVPDNQPGRGARRAADRGQRDDLRDAPGPVPRAWHGCVPRRPQTVGLLYAAPGVGAVLGPLTSGWVTKVRRIGRAVTLSAMAWGAAIVGVGLTSNLALALLLLALAGAVAALTTPTFSVLSGGLGCILGAGAVAWLIPECKHAFAHVLLGAPWSRRWCCWLLLDGRLSPWRTRCRR
jgi:hypothetical protein